MSLINEALKKAQHQRTGSALDAPPIPGGGHMSRGSPGLPKGMLLLVGAGAVVVIVVSVVATVYFVNRSSAPVVAERPAPVKLGPVFIPKPAPSSSPVVIAPVVIPQPAPTPTPAASNPGPIPAPAASTPPATTAVAAAAADSPPTAAKETTPPAETAPAAPGPEAPLADRIADYVDKVRVMGIRTSETGASKVLMNDKVYRINDVVNRSLGLKLVKIEPDSLTFADATGATYVKNF